METPVKQDSFLARPTTERQEEDEVVEEEEEEGETLHQIKTTTTRSRAARPSPRHAQTHTRQTREPFSHTDRRLTEGSLPHGLPSDHLLLSPSSLLPHTPLPLSSPLPLHLSLFTLHCKSDLFKALAYLHTPATALYIVWQFDYCICISVVPVVLCLTGKLCVEIFSTRKQPWPWIFPINSWHA